MHDYHVPCTHYVLRVGYWEAFLGVLRGGSPVNRAIKICELEASSICGLEANLASRTSGRCGRCALLMASLCLVPPTRTDCSCSRKSTRLRSAQDFDLGGGFHYSGSYPMVFQHSGAQDFDLGGGFHYSGSYPMVFHATQWYWEVSCCCLVSSSHVPQGPLDSHLASL